MYRVCGAKLAEPSAELILHWSMLCVNWRLRASSCVNRRVVQYVAVKLGGAEDMVNGARADETTPVQANHWPTMKPQGVGTVPGRNGFLLLCTPP